MLAAIASVLAVVVGLVNRAAADRIATAAKADIDRTDDGAPTDLGTVLRSPFGVTLALVVLIMVSAQAIESQYPNYMQAVFDIDPSASAGALSLIVAVSIPIYLLAGRWTASAGPRTPFLVSAIARAGAGAGLLLLPADAGVAALVVFGIIMVVYPLFELNAATLAAMTSPIGGGAGQGAVGAAMALGTIIAAVAAGWVADQIGFSSLAAITLAAAGVAAVLGVRYLRLPGEVPERT